MGFGAPGGQIWPFPLLWLVALTTACITVQAVISPKQPRIYRRGQTDTQTHTQTYSSQYFTTAFVGKVIILELSQCFTSGFLSDI